MTDWTPTEPDTIYLALGTKDVVVAHFRFMHSCMAYCEKLKLTMIPCAKFNKAGERVLAPQVGDTYNGLAF